MIIENETELLELASKLFRILPPHNTSDYSDRPYWSIDNRIYHQTQNLICFFVKETKGSLPHALVSIDVRDNMFSNSECDSALAILLDELENIRSDYVATHDVEIVIIIDEILSKYLEIVNTSRYKLN